MSDTRPPWRLVLAQTICRPLPPFLSQRVRAVLYPWSAALRHSFEYVVRCQTGSLFKGNTGDFTCYAISVHGYNTFRNWAIALGITQPGDTIIEVGANTGTETMGFSDIVGPTGKVFAFEPVPRNLNVLTENLGLNHATNVKVYPIALADRPGTAKFQLPTAANSGIGRLDSGTDSEGTIEVKLERLDDLAEEIGPSSLIAMDAEGAELLVLRGGRKYIERFMPVIILEARQVLLERMGLSLEALRGELAGLGYEILLIDKVGLKEIPSGAGIEAHQGDWLCVPAGRRKLVSSVQSSLRKCMFLPCISGLNPMTASAR